ncbi:hypothetical protein B0H10DRAFT_1961546 [Mycena sp. CBHHK59/15]|nr:hypothetical protein B0H10DRAFT_1961546 [Mycena sp. CBHHK59/15]
MPLILAYASETRRQEGNALRLNSGGNGVRDSWRKSQTRAPEGEKKKVSFDLQRNQEQQQGSSRSNWRATVEEVEDEEDSESNKRAELPFRKVTPVEFSHGSTPPPKSRNGEAPTVLPPNSKGKSYELKAPIESKGPESLNKMMDEILDSYVRVPFRLILESHLGVRNETGV